ncbi:MAG TPA: hypothetical protein VGR72_06620 [Candidatus Acidoferrales bacterium]|nr:hypothetical protein [Candidatus Acidoferrales bacterium]HEV2340524.1 hypothetical protein [Candidatus Acidoferrales bacterium]
MLGFIRCIREALFLFISASLFVVPVNLHGQDRPGAKTAHVPVPKIAPRPQDVATMDGILSAFYDVVSGPAGQPRQWSRDLTLYVPGVLFISTEVGKDGKPYHQIMSHQQFVDTYNSSVVSQGFYEQEIHRVTSRYGTIAHVMSTYVMRRTPNGPLIGRGVNSLELLYDRGRWWIVSDLWDEERPGNQLPKELLP